MKRYFYFRTVADIADDDSTVDSILIPVDNIVAFHITGNTTIEAYFDSVTFIETDQGARNTDKVALTINDSSGHKVIKALCEATNQGPHHDGIVTIADDVLTINTSDEFQAMKDIAEAIGGNKDGAILLGDDVAGTYISTSITSIGDAV